jgi:hypothetical protein
MARKGKKFWLRFGVIVLILAGLATFNYWPVHEKIIISPQTTVIDGPVNPDGTINYVAYLDAKYAEGITPDNNAAPLLIKAGCLNEVVRAQTLRRLDMSEADCGGASPLIHWVARAVRSTATQPPGVGNLDPDDRSRQVYERLMDGSVITNDPEIAAWLAENAGVLKLVEQACMKTRCYFPILTTSNPPRLIDVVLPKLSALSAAHELFCTRAIVRFRSGDIEGALGDVMNVHRLARLVDQVPFTISQLAAVNFERAASRVGIYMFANASVPPELAAFHLTNLTSLCPAADVPRSVDESERFVGLDVIMILSRGDGNAQLGPETPSTAGGAFYWNDMLRDCNHFFDGRAKVLRTSRFDGRAAAAADLWKRLGEFIERATSGNRPSFVEGFGGRLTRRQLSSRIGALVLSLSVPSLEGAVDVQDDGQMWLEVEKTAVALALYKTRHGRFPASLKDLCPELLKEVPRDVFSPKGELVYRANEAAYILYSIGRNLKDDGGVSDNTGKDDIVAKVGDVDSGATLPASRPGR